MLQAIIIDDEENSRLTLKNMLHNFCKDVEVLAMAHSVPAGVKAIQSHKPDVVFLDIEMPVHNGFELFEFLPEMESEVIFTTAYDQYAIRAFKFSAVDYLLKPIDLEELRAAIARLKEKKKPSKENEKFKVLSYNIRNPFRKLGLPTLEGYTFIQLNDIVRCEADSNYTCFHSIKGKKILVPKTLKEYELLLSDFNFIRVHRSHIVNLDHVQKYTKTRTPTITMADGASISVSSRRKEELLERLGKIN